MSQRRRALIAKLVLSVDSVAIPRGGITRRLGKVVINQVLTPQEKVVLQVQDGLAKGIWLDLNPRTDSHYYRGDAEQPVQEALRRWLHPGMVAYDIGANVGFFTLLMRRLVGESGQLFAFEPDPDVVCELKANVDRNGYEGVSIVGAAVWSSTGSVRFARADPRQSPNRGTGSVGGNGADDCIVSESVRLDEFVQSAPPPHLIKCDVEGAEVEVLRGARELMAEYHPTILSEVHSAGNGRELARILGSAEYVLESIDPTHLLATPRAESKAK